MQLWGWRWSSHLATMRGQTWGWQTEDGGADRAQSLMALWRLDFLQTSCCVRKTNPEPDRPLLVQFLLPADNTILTNTVTIIYSDIIISLFFVHLFPASLSMTVPLSQLPPLCLSPPYHILPQQVPNSQEMYHKGETQCPELYHTRHNTCDTKPPAPIALLHTPPEAKCPSEHLWVGASDGGWSYHQR